MFGIFKPKEVKEVKSSNYADFYQFMLNNASAHLHRCSKLSESAKEEMVNAFDISIVLGVVLCKPSEEILRDIINNKPDYLE